MERINSIDEYVSEKRAILLNNFARLIMKEITLDQYRSVWYETTALEQLEAYALAESRYDELRKRLRRLRKEFKISVTESEKQSKERTSNNEYTTHQEK